MRKSTLLAILGIAVIVADFALWSALFAGARTEAQLQRMAADSASQLPFILFAAVACFIGAWRLRRDENKKK